MLVGIHVDISDHPPIFKDIIPLQSLTIPFFDSRHIQGRPATLRTRTAASPLKPSDTVVHLFFRIPRMCDPITKPVSGLVCVYICTPMHIHMCLPMPKLVCIWANKHTRVSIVLHTCTIRALVCESVHDLLRARLPNPPHVRACAHTLMHNVHTHPYAHIHMLTRAQTIVHMGK